MMPRSLPAIRSQPAPTVVPRGGPPQSPNLPDEDAGLDWRRIASALLRFKWVVILMVALGLGAAVAATRVLRPVYRAQADAWVELLRSYIVLDQVVRDLHLYLEVKRPVDRSSFAGFGVSDIFRPGKYRLSVSADGRG